MSNAGPLDRPPPTGHTRGKEYRMMSASGKHPVLDLEICPCAGGTLDKLIQPAILVVLAAGPLHGYRLAERIGRMPMFGGNPPDVSGVYRFLKAMECKGLVVSSWDLSEHGPPRKCYRLTKAGERCLSRWVETLEEYRQGITMLLKTARKVFDT
jgi:DNA-binding PadR family transcriptional regulator